MTEYTQMTIPTMEENFGLSLPIVMKMRNNSDVPGKYVEVGPQSGQGIYKHDNPNPVGGSYTFNIPTGRDVTYDMSKSRIAIQMDITLTDAFANVVTGTSKFGKVYSLDRTVWNATSYQLSPNTGITNIGSYVPCSLQNPIEFKKTWLNPGMPTSMSLIDNASVQISNFKESKSEVYRRGAYLMESIPQTVCQQNFPHTFLDYIGAIQFDTRYYNYAAMGTDANRISELLVQTTATANSLGGGVSDGPIAIAGGGIWALMPDVAAAYPTETSLAGARYKKKGWNVWNLAGASRWGQNLVATDLLTFTHQHTFYVPLNVLFTSLQDQMFFGQTFDAQNQFQLNLTLQQYNFSYVLGGTKFVNALSAAANQQFVLRNASVDVGAGAEVYTASDAFISPVGTITGQTVGTGLTRVILEMYEIPMPVETPEIVSKPIIQIPVMDNDVNIVNPLGTWYTAMNNVGISCPHESITRFKLALQQYDVLFGGLQYPTGAASNTSCWQSGRRTWIPFNAIPTLLNMNRKDAQRALIGFWKFTMKYGGKAVFDLSNDVSSIDFLNQTNIEAINAQANYQVPSGENEILWNAINYGLCMDVNLTQLTHTRKQFNPCNDGINTKVANLTFSNQPVIYANTAAINQDTTIDLIPTITNLTYYMPNLTSSLQYEWFCFFNAFQKYFPTSHAFQMSEDLTTVQ